MGEALKSSQIWQLLCKVIVLEPDGWDRSNFEASWNELITRKEFVERMMKSTCYWDAEDPDQPWKDL
jgi:hypothetical protein